MWFRGSWLGRLYKSPFTYAFALVGALAVWAAEVPLDALRVRGDAVVEGQLTAQQNATVSGSLSAGNASIAGNVSVGGNASVGGSLSVGTNPAHSVLIGTGTDLAFSGALPQCATNTAFLGFDRATRAFTCNAPATPSVPWALVSRTTSQNIPASSTVTISWDFENFDSGNFWTNAQPTRFTFSDSALYLVVASAYTTSTLNATGSMQLVANGTTQLAKSGGPSGGTIARIVGANPGLYVEVTITNQSTSAVTLEGSARFQVVRLGNA